MDHQLIHEAERICNGANCHRVRTALLQYVGACELLEDEKDEGSRTSLQVVQDNAEATIRQEIGKANRQEAQRLRVRHY